MIDIIINKLQLVKKNCPLYRLDTMRPNGKNELGKKMQLS